MKRKLRWGSIFMLLFFLFFAFAPSIANAAGWVNESLGLDRAVYNFEKYPLENYSLDFYVDTSWNWLPWKWGEGIGDTIIYGLYAITNAIWLLNVYISYFIGYIVQEAFDLDFITSFVGNLATNMQRIGGIDSNGLRATGLFPIYGKWLILIMGCYVVYIGTVKRQTTRAIQHAVIFAITFIASGVFLMNSNNYLTEINNAQKDVNAEMLVIAKEIIPSSSNETIVDAPGSNVGEQRTRGATNAIRENLFELQISTPWRVLQFGDSDVKTIGKSRVENIVKLPSVNKDRDAKIKEEVEKHNNKSVSVNGAFLRFGMTLLVFVANAIVSYSVIVLTITMITSQILFLLFCAFLPVAMVFALFPNSNRILFGAMQKVAQALMSKMGITLILAVVFSLSHSFFNLAQTKGYIWVIFLQIATWLTAVNKVNELLGFMHLGGADTKQGSKLGNMAKSLLLAGTARKILRGNSRANVGMPKEDLTVIKPPKAPVAKRVGTKIANLQDMPNKINEKVGTVKDTVKNAPTNAKYKALQMKNNYDDGRMGTDLKNSQNRSDRMTKRQMTQQERLEALRKAEQNKKDFARNQMAHRTNRNLDEGKIPKEKTAVRPTTNQSNGKRIAQVSVKPKKTFSETNNQFGKQEEFKEFSKKSAENNTKEKNRVVKPVHYGGFKLKNNKEEKVKTRKERFRK